MDADLARAVIREQFCRELDCKECELRTIEERIQLAKLMLHRLRLGILAQHYNLSSLCPPEDYTTENIGVQGSWEAFERAFLDAEVANGCSTASEVCSQEEGEGEGEEGAPVVEVYVKNEECSDSPALAPPSSSDASSDVVVSRFYVKKRVIVGNTSQFIDPKVRGTDGSTHKWMVYVRGPSKEASISNFVSSIRFFLHPSYHPNDIVTVSKPPFQLTRLGWGEFPIRAQLEFVDKRNKPVDIIHNLILDRTHTGQQTLGAETVVDLDIISASGVDGASCTTKLGLDEDWGSGEEEVRTREVEGEEEEPSTVCRVCLPCTKPSDAILLDHDYCVPVVVSRPPAPPTRPQVVTMNLDKYLHHTVQSLPLYGRSLEELPVSARSIEQFKGWSVGRRRAVEWLRAVAVRKHLHKKLSVAFPTTKQVVEWCRKNGYTPLDPATRGTPGFCKLCGCQLPYADSSDVDGEPIDYHWSCSERLTQGEHVMGFSTLSSPYEMFTGDRHCMLQPVLGTGKEQDVWIDVESVDEEKRRVCPVEHLPKFRVPQTPELKWVQQTAGSVGVAIYPAVIERMYAHVVEHMVFMACSKFVKAILTEAVHESGRVSGGASCREKVLLPIHIYQAVQNLEFCDFLTDKYLGLPSSERSS